MKLCYRISGFLDVYEAGTVPPEHMPHRKFILLPQFEDEINEYLNACKKTYSETQQRNIKTRCTGFMRFIQNRGLTDVSALGYEDILAYHADIPHKEGVSSILYESSIKLFLSNLADKGRCSHGLGWFLHYFQSNRIVAADTVACPGIYCQELQQVGTVGFKAGRSLP